MKYILIKNNKKQPNEFPENYLEVEGVFSFYNYNIIDEEKTRQMVQEFADWNLDKLEAEGYKITNRLVTNVMNKLQVEDMGILMDKDQERIALIKVCEDFKPDKEKTRKCNIEKGFATFEVIKELNGYEEVENWRKQITKENKQYSRGFTILDLTKNELEAFRTGLNNIVINNG